MTDETSAPTDPAQAEAEGIETVTITFDGHKYEIPASFEDVDVAAVRAFESGQGFTAAAGILGEGQWAKLERRYRKAHGGRFPASAATPLAEAIAVQYGFEDPGE